MAGVIRRDNYASAPAFSFRNLEDDARRIIEQAHAEAAQIRANATKQAAAELDQLRERATQKGLKQGRAEGLEAIRREATETALRDARRQLDALAETLRTAATQIEQRKHNLLARAQTGIIELAIAIARRVCKTDIACATDSARANAAKLIQLIGAAHDPVLHVHPDQLVTMRIAVAALVKQIEQLAHIDVVADPAVSRGGCILHTRESTIDATIETQLDRIAEALLPDQSTAEPS